MISIILIEFTDKVYKVIMDILDIKFMNDKNVFVEEIQYVVKTS